MNKIKALFIDCDGVLYDKAYCSTEDIAVVAFGKTLSAFGLTKDEVDQRHTELKKQGIRGLFNVILDFSRKNHFSFRDFTIEMASHIDFGRIPPDPELLQLLKKVGHKTPIYITTNNSCFHLFNVMKTLSGGTFRQFDDLNITPIAIEDTLYDGCFHSKRMTGQFLNLCTTVNQMPADVLVLDDTPNVCEAAKSQGLQAQQINGPEDTKTVLRSLLNERTKTKGSLSLRETRGGASR